MHKFYRILDLTARRAGARHTRGERGNGVRDSSTDAISEVTERASDILDNRRCRGSKGNVDTFQVTCRECRIELQLQEVVLSVKQFKEKRTQKTAPVSLSEV